MFGTYFAAQVILMNLHGHYLIVLQLVFYGGPEVTFSHSDFYKVNEIVFKLFLFDFSKVEQVLFKPFPVRL